jgi:hypothetical protein
MSTKTSTTSSSAKNPFPRQEQYRIRTRRKQKVDAFSTQVPQLKVWERSAVSIPRYFGIFDVYQANVFEEIFSGEYYFVTSRMQVPAVFELISDLSGVAAMRKKRVSIGTDLNLNLIHGFSKAKSRQVHPCVLFGARGNGDLTCGDFVYTLNQNGVNSQFGFYLKIENSLDEAFFRKLHIEKGENEVAAGYFLFPFQLPDSSIAYNAIPDNAEGELLVQAWMKGGTGIAINEAFEPYDPMGVFIALKGEIVG